MKRNLTALILLTSLLLGACGDDLEDSMEEALDEHFSGDVCLPDYLLGTGTMGGPAEWARPLVKAGLLREQVVKGSGAFSIDRYNYSKTDKSGKKGICYGESEFAGFAED
ncbi:MAG: hypothetical protein ACK5HY_01580, partial [Parahaliea sp.]